MRRLILTLAATAAMLGAPPAADVALARDKDGARGGEHWRRDDGRRGGRSGDVRREERRFHGPPPGAYAPPRDSRVRRGGYLPPDHRGALVRDHERHRLRPPPRGYTWRRMGDDFLLVSPEGQVFDMIVQ